MTRVQKDNRVIIRIWTSKRNQGRDVGHVSIQTAGRYMSLWPKENALGILSLVRSEFKRDADADIKAEGRVSEKLYCLYSLDASAMEARFDKIKSDPTFKGWTLLGDNLLLNKGNAHSCASLAYTLLQTGGIYSLISSLNSSNRGLSSAASPDALAGILVKAKQAELTRYRDTKKFTRFSRPTKILDYDDAGVSKPRVEEETSTSTQQSTYCSTNTAMAAAATVVGVFAVGGYIYSHPESVAEYLPSVFSS